MVSMDAVRNSGLSAGDTPHRARRYEPEPEQVNEPAAGTGEAVNLDTGAVTAPGEPLDPIADEGTGGTPLDPPQPGADEDGFGGDAPEPATAEDAVEYDDNDDDPF